MYVPDELKRYQYDHQAERRAKRLPRIMGFATLALLIAAIALFCLKQATWGVGMFIIFFMAGIASSIVWKRKKNVSCRICMQPMEPFDTVFPPNELGKINRKWMNKRLFKGDGRSLFEGADGCVYEVSSAAQTGALYWHLSKYNLRFYACRQCHSYFRYGNVINELKHKIEASEIEELKEQIETDPHALEKKGSL